MTKEKATEIVEKFERSVIEAQHKLATDANLHFVARLRRELIELLENTKRAA